jgi:hypothetical protein
LASKRVPQTLISPLAPPPPLAALAPSLIRPPPPLPAARAAVADERRIHHLEPGKQAVDRAAARVVFETCAQDRQRAVAGQEDRPAEALRTRPVVGERAVDDVGAVDGAAAGHAVPDHVRIAARASSRSVYRYHVSREAIADGYDTCPVRSLPAADVEGAVLGHVQKLLAAPELAARTWAAAKREGEDEITEREVTILLADFATVWSELFPAEQARILQILVERADVQ